MTKLRLFLVVGIIFLSILSIGYTESVFFSSKHKEYGELKGCKECHSEKYLKHQSVTSNDCTICHETREEEPYSDVENKIKTCRYCGAKYYKCEICGGDHHKCRHKKKAAREDFYHEERYCNRCHSTNHWIEEMETPSFYRCLLKVCKECWTCHGEKPKEVVKIKEVIKEYKKADELADCKIYFDTDMTNIKPEFEPVLKKIADYLQRNPKCKLCVIGHTDSVWTHDYNVDLSKKRASSVIDALVSKYNIDSTRLIPHGVGDLHPMDTNETEEGRAKNRRVQVEILEQ